MVKEFRFNTGRLYGPGGQVIWARYDDEARTITFADLSRGIDGRFPCKQWNPSEHYVKNTTMSCYDRMAYSSDADTLRFLNNEASKLETAWQKLQGAK